MKIVPVYAHTSMRKSDIKNVFKEMLLVLLLSFYRYH